MEKKYYDLIVTLIKSNRKYPGLEHLLEEIANDVYEKSISTISSINDEKTIINYL